MSERPLCSICGKRRPERFCPAKGEKICAVCCGTEREVTLDCPPDCAYLVAAHRYELEHRPPPSEADFPFPKVEIRNDLLYERQGVLTVLGRGILQFAAQHRDLTDADALAAIEALAETYRTLSSGIYYAKPPDSATAGALYAALQDFLGEVRQQESRQPGIVAVKDGELFPLLVFLARVGRSRTNGRPRARLFLQFLASQFPEERPQQAEASRIILP